MFHPSVVQLILAVTKVAAAEFVELFTETPHAIPCNAAASEAAPDRTGATLPPDRSMAFCAGARLSEQF